MNLEFIFRAVMRYGIKGVKDYFIRKILLDNTERIVRGKLVKDVTPAPGITIIGCLDSVGSLSKTLRDFAILLKKAGIPFQTLNLPCEHPIPDSEYKHLLTPEDQFVTNMYTDIVMLWQSLNIPDKRCRMNAIEFWEFEDGFKEEHPEILNSPNIIAMSDFNFEVFQKTVPKSNVHKILYPFQFNHGPLAPIAETRQKYGIPKDAFVVFFNFDYCSSYYRKNPEAILRAFRKAFAANENAALVFKTMRAKKCAAMSKRLHALAHELNMDQQLITLDDFIPQEDLVNLTNSCDCYISLHRGEGFGLGIAEAMSLGKAVIVTDYSATTEFCNSNNAILIPFHLIKIRPDEHDVDHYKYVTKWAESDTDAAAKALRKLYDNPQIRNELGKRAKAFIDDYFSVDNFKKSINEFLSRQTSLVSHQRFL